MFWNRGVRHNFIPVLYSLFPYCSIIFQNKTPPRELIFLLNYCLTIHYSIFSCQLL
nr:MAG TPA_asm: hypothetical protein [Caudoviricetes sp.]